MNEPKALKYIKKVLVAGIIVDIFFALSYLAMLIVVMNMQVTELKSIFSTVISMVISICIISGMTWGVYVKKSRVCAILLFSFTMFFLIFGMVKNIKISLLIFLVLLKIYFNGIRATMYYHNKIKNNE